MGYNRIKGKMGTIGMFNKVIEGEVVTTGVMIKAAMTESDGREGSWRCLLGDYQIP